MYIIVHLLVLIEAVIQISSFTLEDAVAKFIPNARN